MRDAVVTGGAGAIGSQLVRRLLLDGQRVHVLDNFSSGHRWLLPESPNLRVVDVDVSLPMRDPRSFPEIPEGCDVYHLAAHFANALSVKDPRRDLQVNGEGTLAAIQWSIARRANRFVFASAGCAAGHVDTPYQIHKTLGETYCRYFFDEMPACIMRFHNSYGPGEVPGPYRNVIPNWIWNAIRREGLTVYGDGSDARDFVYVDDVVQQMIDARPSLTPQEVGTGKLTSARRLAEMICELVVTDAPIVHGPRRSWDHAGRASKQSRPGMVALPIGLSLTVDWHLAYHEQITECMRSKSCES